MSECIIIDDEKIFLATFIKEQPFGRTDLGRHIEEKGALITLDENQVKEFEPWTFSNTKILSDGMVYFEGNGIKGKTLLSLFLQDSSTKNIQKESNFVDEFAAVMNAIDFCKDKDLLLPGAGGILVGEKNNSIRKILILPGELFERCTMNSTTQDYSLNQGFFIKKGLLKQESFIFTRGAFAYRALCKKFPFDKIDFEKRQLDMTDSNFIPLEYQIINIDKDFAEKINSSLKVKSPPRKIAGERRRTNEAEEEKRQQTIKIAQELSAKEFELALKKISEEEISKSQQEAFDKIRNSFIKKQKKNILTKRFLRRNKNRILFAVVAIIIAVNVAVSFYRTNGKLATSLGLNSVQTVQTLYTGIHRADVTIIQEIAKGKTARSLVTTTAGFFVSNKQRQIMDEKSGTLTPGQWLFFKGNTDFWQYGLTNFKIDGNESSVNFNFPRRNQNPAPLASENGEKLKKNDTMVHTVEYDLVHYDGATVIAVNSIKDTVTLKWNGKKWLVRNIKGKSISTAFSASTYKKDYKLALEQCDENIKKAASLLRKKYPFVPTDKEIFEERNSVIKEFNLSAAKEY